MQLRPGFQDNALPRESRGQRVTPASRTEGKGSVLPRGTGSASLSHQPRFFSQTHALCTGGLPFKNCVAVSSSLEFDMIKATRAHIVASLPHPRKPCISSYSSGMITGFIWSINPFPDDLLLVGF